MKKQMQKLKQELNANTVGATIGRPHFEEIAKKNQKGITLIALIITIIVMLILVGVTINVALNGGLFTKAETAKSQTLKELEKEELMSIVLAAYDANTGKIEKTDLNFNGKYTEEIDKTTTEKVVVKGESGMLWEIDITSAKVEEYTKQELPEFYGVAYIMKTSSETVQFWFLENNIMLMKNDKGIMAAFNYTKNNNELIIGGSTGTIIEDNNAISPQYWGRLERDENDIYVYSPSYNQSNNIYLNAIYASATTGNLMVTTDAIIQNCESGLDPSGSHLFADMQAKGIELNQDGKQITYNGNIYTLIEEI